ncbi:MAG: hypothetical protein RL341_1494 [Pseudomonadota bacterium]|jgi:hypothetical protein
MELAQLQIVYDALQDRLLMRVNTTAGQEVRAWLTRRLLHDLWPTWQRAVEHARSLALPAGATDEARRALVSMEREHAVATTNFSTPFGQGIPAAGLAPAPAQTSPYSPHYKPPKNPFPLGDAPLLVNEVSLTPMSDGSLQTQWKDGAKALGIVMNAQLMHAATKLLMDGAAQADWGLTLETAVVATQAPAIKH